MKQDLLFVFDVESIGLHGEGFAVGYVVMDKEGNRMDSGCLATDPCHAKGNAEGHDWAKKNIGRIEHTHNSAWQMRSAFWSKWQEWKAKGATLYADCAWPVEARFLIACIDDYPAAREWGGPYPLHDIASVCAAKGIDPITTKTRLEDELPVHNPLADARQSARLLLEAFRSEKSDV